MTNSLIPRPIIHKLLRVLTNKFGRDQEELAHVVVFLSELGEVVRPRCKRSVLRDEADNRILECAEAGSADLIVTGDREILASAEFKQTKIVTLRNYLTVE